MTYKLKRIALQPVFVTTAAVLALLAYAGLLGIGVGSQRNLITLPLILLPALLIGLGLLATRFRLLALLLPITALMAPYELSTNTESVLNMSLLLCMALTGTWVVSMAIRRTWLAPSPLNIPLLAFGAVTIIATIWGYLWIDPLVARPFSFIVAQAASLVAILLSLSAALIVGNFYTTERTLKYLVGVYLVLLSVLVVCRLTGIADAIQLPYYIFLTQFIINDRGLWAVWLCAIAYGLLIAQPGLRWYWRLALLIILALTLYETIINNSLWLSGWIPNLVAITVITFVYSRRLFFSFCLVVAGWVVVSQDFLLRVFADDLAGGSLERLDLWSRTFEIVRNHWLLGTGTAGYTLYFRSFYPYDLRSTHNGYMDILGQFGVVGVVLWVWFVVVTLIEALRLYNAAPPGFLRTMILIIGGGWTAALASMVLGDWVLPYTYNQTISGFKYTIHSWFFLGALISIRQLMTRQGLLNPRRGTQLNEVEGRAGGADGLAASHNSAAPRTP